MTLNHLIEVRTLVPVLTGTDFDTFKKVGFSGTAMSGPVDGNTVKLYIKHDATESFTFIVNFAFIKIADAPSEIV